MNGIPLLSGVLGLTLMSLGMDGYGGRPLPKNQKYWWDDLDWDSMHPSTRIVHLQPIGPPTYQQWLQLEAREQRRKHHEAVRAEQARLKALCNPVV